MKFSLLPGVLLLAQAVLPAAPPQNPDGKFFVDRWAEFQESVSNTTDGRWRVNDEDVSLHPSHGKRYETTANGLIQIPVTEDLFELEAAELYLELWGGHPGNARKRFTVNGRGPYLIPEVGAAAGNCTYSYPTVPVKVSNLVRGVNSFQFTGDRAETFWGHYIVDNARIRLYLKADNPLIEKADLSAFSASVAVADGSRILGNTTELHLNTSGGSIPAIKSVTFHGRYLDYDDNGDGVEDDWHGFTLDRKPVNVIGEATQPPFLVKWDTAMIPDQAGDLAVRALVRFENGVSYWTPVVGGLSFPATRRPVKRYRCPRLPMPFWSRDHKPNTAVLMLPDDLSQVAGAELWLKIWDGGEGDVKQPFRLNGHPYGILTERPDKFHPLLVFRKLPVDLDHLKPGRNEIELLSGTDHHGIEMFLPGPVLKLKYR